MSNIEYKQLHNTYFDGVIKLGNSVHGDNYLNHTSLLSIYQSGVKEGVNASWVALKENKVVGFRLTMSAGNWSIDNWCSPDLWRVDSSKVCYFKCNTVHQDCRGLGVGTKLLQLSIQQVKKQGSLAGLAHIWLASPANSAFRYFSRSGGMTVKEHPGKWRNSSIVDGYVCPVCPGICECVAAEMILKFTD